MERPVSFFRNQGHFLGASITCHLWVTARLFFPLCFSDVSSGSSSNTVISGASSWCPTLSLHLYALRNEGRGRYPRLICARTQPVEPSARGGPRFPPFGLCLILPLGIILLWSHFTGFSCPIHKCRPIYFRVVFFSPPALHTSLF